MAEADEAEPAPSKFSRRVVAVAAAIVVAVAGGTAGAVALYDDGGGREDGPTPLAARIALDCPATVPAPGPLDPRATTGNGHTLARGALAVRICSGEFSREGNLMQPAVPWPTTLYRDVEKFITAINDLSGEEPPETCTLAATPYVPLEILYPDGVRVSVPLKLGGCGVLQIGDAVYENADELTGIMSRLLEKQRLADPPVPAPGPPTCPAAPPKWEFAAASDAITSDGRPVPYPAAALTACRYDVGADGNWVLTATEDRMADAAFLRDRINELRFPGPPYTRFGCPSASGPMVVLYFADVAGGQYRVAVHSGQPGCLAMLVGGSGFTGQGAVDPPEELLERLGL
ncbi:hypothetical protein [Yinghuangia soli]|uniref:Uncharacterized protein n=1 Tax=Yinghuangia soli TaxID=2908204 RepID=A0AA41U1T0_9ACTN|nr:hypothetical protein [Yinghuangia soli]MCF2527882.1 hypothetical protein [Yinghuangia soli]